MATEPKYTIDPASVVPPYRQLHDAVLVAIQAGELRPGERMPTTRALAAQLGLAVNTVAAAYRSLEAVGVLEGRGRAGTFVQLGDDPVEAQARRIALDAVAQLRQLQIGREQGVQLVAEAYAVGE